MTDLTNYAENELTDHLLGTGAYTAPTNVYLALFTAAPSDSGGGTEVTGNAYAREQTTFGAASNGVASNTAALSFTAAGGNWGTVTHVAVMDALTAGNMLVQRAITTQRTVNDGETLEFAIGAVTFTLA